MLLGDSERQPPCCCWLADKLWFVKHSGARGGNADRCYPPTVGGHCAVCITVGGRAGTWEVLFLHHSDLFPHPGLTSPMHLLSATLMSSADCRRGGGGTAAPAPLRVHPGPLDGQKPRGPGPAALCSENEEPALLIYQMLFH